MTGRWRDADGAAAVVAFAVFGAFWGAWGGSIPRIQRQAGLDDGRFGVALLFVGAAALPAMLLVGRSIDRFGLRLAGFVLPAMCVAGAALSISARSLSTVSAGLAVVGATSGAADVAINSVAGAAEARTGAAVITRSHATFSGLVVLASVGAGVCAATSLAVWVPFAVLAAAGIVAGAWLAMRLPGRPPQRLPRSRPARGDRRATVRPLVLVGALGALAFASENAHQSWSAVFAHDELHAGSGLATGAPAIFAAVVAASRFAIGRVPFRLAGSVVVAGGAAAAAGATVLALAPGLAIAAIGLAIAAVGTAVLFPTLMRFVARRVEPDRRGQATSLVTGISYLGFLVGPVYVGLWSDATSLRGAMVAVGALGAVFAVLARPLLGRGGLAAVAGSDLRDHAEVQPVPIRRGP
jgi:MFS family permease